MIWYIINVRGESIISPYSKST